jgi:twitching motility protein PilT
MPILTGRQQPAACGRPNAARERERGVDPVLDLDQLLRAAVEQGASDVHIKVGSPPFIRVDGRLDRSDYPSVSPVETERIAFAIMPKQRAEEFIVTCEADFAYSVSGLGRFRVNVMRQRGSVGLVFRRVQTVTRKLSENQRGLVLVTGPTGSGKTTTLGAMIDYINDTQYKHIVTIEDPIEILHSDKASIVNQREVGTDTVDFNAALKRVLRQDPDVILVGEMRDVETVKTALTAAETGHLVFSTLHTISATDSINRIIDFFPPHEQRQVRMSLAASLRGIVSQRLVERRGGGRLPAVEILVSTGRVFDKIVNPDETHEIEEIIAEGEYYGMQTFDQSLLGLYRNGLVELREVMSASTSPHDLRLMIEQYTMQQAAQQAAAG